MPWGRSYVILLFCPSPLLIPQAYSLPWSFKIALLTGLYASIQSMTVPCPQSNHNTLFKTKQIISCPCCKSPMTYYTTQYILYYKDPLQIGPALSILTLCHCPVSISTDPRAFVDFSNTSDQSNLKIFVPAIPTELNSISCYPSMESSFYGEFILT